MNSILQDFLDSEIAKLSKDKHVDFGIGDTIVVKSKSNKASNTGKSSDRSERLQAFEGVCIAKRNRGIATSFKLRRVCKGIGIEKSYLLYSPLIDSLEIIRKGKVRRAKLYYIRKRVGKTAKIKQDFSYKATSN